MSEIRTATITLNNDLRDGYAKVNYVNGHTFTFVSSNAVAPYELYVTSAYGTPGLFGGTRALFEFDWELPISVSAEGFLQDPPVFSAASLVVFVQTPIVMGLSGVDLEVYVANEPRAANQIKSGVQYHLGPMQSYGSRTSLLFRDYLKATDRPYNVTEVGTHEIPLSVAALNSVIRDDGGTAAWQGRLHLVVMVKDEDASYFGPAATLASPTSSIRLSSAADVDPTRRPKLDIQYTDYHTGWQGRAHGAFRGVRDSRYGAPAYTDRLVEDQFQRGLWVFPWDQDPDDPFERDRPLNPNEGVIDRLPVR